MTELVLLTSVGLDAQSWQWLELADGVEVHYFEYPGHGDVPFIGRYELQDMADAVVGNVGGPFHVAGISMGGMVAQHIASRFPDLLQSAFIACCTAAVDPAIMLDRAQQAQEMSEAYIAGNLSRWFTPEALTADPEHQAVDYTRKALRRLAPGAMSACWQAIAGHDQRGKMRHAAMPVTCVGGIHDPAAPPGAIEALAGEFPNARIISLEGPHLLQLERPLSFSRAIRDHLAWAGVDA